MEYTLPPLVTTGNDAGFGDFVEQEGPTPIMESPKRESSEWTDEKHSLYLKSMEASFVDQLYNSSHMQRWRTQNECLSDTMSSRRAHSSGQFKVLQHGFWSRIEFKRESSVIDKADRPHVSPNNPWIQHFRSRTKNGVKESLSPQQNPSSTAESQRFHNSDSQLGYQQTNYNNAEATDQNFVEDDSTNVPCHTKRKREHSRRS